MEIKLEKKNILITGGAGFIGSNLANHLRISNHVVVVDNFLTGTRLNLHPSVQIIEGSAKNLLHFNFKNNFDYVFHFGEYSRVEQSNLEFLNCFENTSSSIGNVIEFCRTNSCKLVYSASSTMFAPDGRFLSPYTFQKAQNVDAINYFCKRMDIPYSIVYFSNVYGENEIANGKYATVIAKFLAAKIQSKSVEVTEPGTQTRAFTHVKDTISGIVLAAILGQGDGYVISSSQQYSIIELCEMMDLSYSLIPGNLSNRLMSHVDTSQISKLGWREYHDLKRYIHEKLNKQTD